MSSEFESYEQDFAVLTADITGRIAKVPKLVGGIGFFITRSSS